MPISLLAAVSVATQAGVYSGRIVDVDGVVRQGITVELKRGDALLASARSGVDGAWSLDPSSSVLPRARDRAATGNLVIDATRRLHVEFGGRDLSGRSRTGWGAVARDPSPASARLQEAAAPDTLVYGIDGRVFLRDTISAPDTGIVRIFDTTWNDAIVYGYLKDSRDGNVYRTVKIGTQIWMAQNLAFVRDTSWRNRDSLEMERRYGRLYQWTAAMDVDGKYNTLLASLDLPARGICPTGWHVPDDAEWSTLIKFVDSANSGTALKTLAFPTQTGVDSARDSWGFRVLPGGQTTWLTTVSPNRYVYRAFGTNGMFWTAAEVNDTKAWVRNFGQNFNHSTRASNPKGDGFSLRCLAN